MQYGFCALTIAHPGSTCSRPVDPCDASREHPATGVLVTVSPFPWLN